MTPEAPRFELDPRLPPAQAAREAALAQIDFALAALAGERDDAVHESRKVCKKLRALLRLIRPFLGHAYRAENRRLRDVGRALSSGREAAVLVETAEALFGADDALEPLAERLRERPRPATAVSRRKARELLRVERRRAQRWAIRELSAGSLLGGLLAGYRRARREYRQARRKPQPAVLHEWRKQAKYHGYQCALAGPLWPDARARIDRLKKLSDALGQHHDLHVLRQFLREHGAELAGRDTLARARERVRAEQRRCADEALRLGRTLFDERPLAWLEESST